MFVEQPLASPGSSKHCHGILITLLNVKKITCALNYLDPVLEAKVDDIIIPLLPKGLGVLVEADLDDVEVLGKFGEGGNGIAQQHVQPAVGLPELLVQVVQALQQEGHLVVLAGPASVII